MPIKPSDAFNSQVRAFMRDRVINAKEVDALYATAKKDIEASPDPFALAKAYQTDGFDKLPYTPAGLAKKDEVDWYLSDGVASVPVGRAAVDLKSLLSQSHQDVVKMIVNVDSIAAVRDGELYVSVRYHTPGMASPQLNAALENAFTKMLAANGHCVQVVVSDPVK